MFDDGICTAASVDEVVVAAMDVGVATDVEDDPSLKVLVAVSARFDAIPVKAACLSSSLPTARVFAVDATISETETGEDVDDALSVLAIDEVEEICVAIVAAMSDTTEAKPV